MDSRKEMAALYDTYYLCEYFFDEELIENRKKQKGFFDTTKKAKKYINKNDIHIPEEFRAFFSVELGVSFVFARLMDLWLDEMNPTRILGDDLINLEKMKAEICKHFKIRMDNKEVIFRDVNRLNLSEDVKKSLLYICYNYPRSLQDMVEMLWVLYDKIKKMHDTKYACIEKLYTKISKEKSIEEYLDECYPYRKNTYYYISLLNDYSIKGNYNKNQSCANLICGAEYGLALNSVKQKPNNISVSSVVEVLSNDNNRLILEYLDKNDTVSQSELSQELAMSMSTSGLRTAALEIEGAILRYNVNGLVFFRINREYFKIAGKALSDYMDRLSG